jgi:hypothetical protein
MRISLLAATAASALLLAACSSDSSEKGTVATDGGDKISSGRATGSSEGSTSEEPGSEENEERSGEEAEVVDFAFTQSDEYVTGIALVRANSEDAVGKFVSLSYNVLDADGQILATEEQIESFSWEGQEIGFPIFVSLDATPGAKAATLDVVADVGDDSYGQEYTTPLPVLEAQSVVEDEYGNGYTASFGFTNDGDEKLESMRAAAVCFDKGGKVIGGATTYPDALPGRTIRIDVEMIDTVKDQKPKTCKAYLNYPA